MLTSRERATLEAEILDLWRDEKIEEIDEAKTMLARVLSYFPQEAQTYLSARKEERKKEQMDRDIEWIITGIHTAKMLIHTIFSYIDSNKRKQVEYDSGKINTLPNLKRHLAFFIKIIHTLPFNFVLNLIDKTFELFQADGLLDSKDVQSIYQLLEISDSINTKQQEILEYTFTIEQQLKNLEAQKAVLMEQLEQQAELFDKLAALANKIGLSDLPQTK